MGVTLIYMPDVYTGVAWVFASFCTHVLKLLNNQLAIYKCNSLSFFYTSIIINNLIN